MSDSLATFLVWVFYEAMVVLTWIIVTWYVWVPIVVVVALLQWILSRRTGCEPILV